MRLISSLCAAAWLLVAPLAASAQMRPLDAPADAPFRHAHSGITVPAVLDGLPRLRAQEFEAPELDVAFEWGSEAERVSVYIYRVTAGSPALWFERAAIAVELRPNFGTLRRADVPVAFTPPGHDAASGMVAIWSVSGGPVRSTALALIPRGEWLVKFRISSAALDVAQLQERLRRTVAAIDWPALAAPEPAVEPVALCTTPLRLDSRAKPIKRPAKDMLEIATADALLAMSFSRRSAAKWCRDDGGLGPLAIYRTDQATDGYLLPLSDSGQSITVAPGLGAAAAAGRRKDGYWAVSMHSASGVTNLAPVDRLPSPDRLVELARSLPVLSTTSWRPGATETRITR